jgi:hypothetical protein
MPEETTTETPPETEGPAIEHDDLMQRLLRYQRQLRGDKLLPPTAEVAEQERPLIDYAAAEAPSATEAETLMVDLTDAEAELEAATVAETPTQEPVPATPEPEHISAELALADQSARIAELEATLTRITQMVSDLRKRFQDLAISADERLSGLEEALAEVRRSDLS